MKSGIASHVKTMRLKLALKIPLYQAIGILESIAQLCEGCADEGDIGRFSNEEIAASLEWHGDADTLVNALIESRWFDVDDECRLAFHDWLDHAPNYIKDRVRKRPANRLRRKNAEMNRQRRSDSEASRNSSGNSQLTHANQEQSNPTQPRTTQPITEQKSTLKVHGSMEDVDHKDSRKEVNSKDIIDYVRTIFEAADYRGSEGGNLWKVAALSHSGIGEITEAEIASACQGAKLIGRKKPAYFYKCLEETLEKRGENLKTLLSRVKIIPKWPKVYPKAKPIKQARTRQTPKSASCEDNRQAVLDKLDVIAEKEGK